MRLTSTRSAKLRRSFRRELHGRLIDEARRADFVLSREVADRVTSTVGGSVDDRARVVG
jgi:hypothetical protein